MNQFTFPYPFDFCVKKFLATDLGYDLSLDDAAGVAEVYARIIPEDRNREYALRMIREAVERGWMKIGHLFWPGMKPSDPYWDMPAQESLLKIEKEWREMNARGQWPRSGDICWLRNTSEGNAVAEEFWNKYRTEHDWSAEDFEPGGPLEHLAIS